MSKLRVAPVKRFLLYISACHVIAKIISLVLLTYFLIRVLGEMSIIYASAVHMCILIYDFNCNLSWELYMKQKRPLWSKAWNTKCVQIWLTRWQINWQMYPPSMQSIVGKIFPGRSSGRSTSRSSLPIKYQMAISYRFLPWGLIPGRSSGRSTGRSSPPIKWQMTISYRFLLWELIPGRSCGRSTPQRSAISQIPTLRADI